MPKPFKFEPPHVGSYNEWIFQTGSELNELNGDERIFADATELRAGKTATDWREAYGECGSLLQLSDAKSGAKAPASRDPLHTLRETATIRKIFAACEHAGPLRHRVKPQPKNWQENWWQED